MYYGIKHYRRFYIMERPEFRGEFACDALLAFLEQIKPALTKGPNEVKITSLFSEMKNAPEGFMDFLPLAIEIAETGGATTRDILIRYQEELSFKMGPLFPSGGLG